MATAKDKATLMGSMLKEIGIRFVLGDDKFRAGFGRRNNSKRKSALVLHGLSPVKIARRTKQRRLVATRLETKSRVGVVSDPTDEKDTIGN